MVILAIINILLALVGVIFMIIPDFGIDLTGVNFSVILGWFGSLSQMIGFVFPAMPVLIGFLTVILGMWVIRENLQLIKGLLSLLQKLKFW